MTWHWEELWRYKEALLGGFFVTARLNAVVIILGTLTGCFVAFLRQSRVRALRLLGRFYVDIFRTLPLLVLLVWLFFAWPTLPGIGLRLDPFPAAVISLTLNLSAFVAEIIRGGVNAVPGYYAEGLRVAGFSTFQIRRHVTAPLAFRLMLAPLFGQYINQVKLSVLASIIAVPELLHTINTIATETFRPLELYTALAAIFLFMLLPGTWLQGWIEARQRKIVNDPLLRAEEEEDLCGNGRKAMGDLLQVGSWPTLPEGAKLVARGVGYTFKEAPVLDNASVEAERGRVVAIIGSNGSGKTTLLRCLAGILKPQRGTIGLIYKASSCQVGAVDWHASGTQRRFGYMTQEHQPLPHLSVLDNLILPLRVLDHVSRSEAEKTAQRWLEIFGLSRKEHVLPAALSGGQRQRLVLAMTLCLRPQVLLLDEPMSSMDFSWSLIVQGMLRELATRGVMVIVVSHGLGFLRHAADTIAFLHRHTIGEVGPASRLMEEPQTQALRSFLEAA